MRRSIVPLLALATMAGGGPASSDAVVIVPRPPDPVEASRFVEPSRGGKARSGARANSAANKMRRKRRRGW